MNWTHVKRIAWKDYRRLGGLWVAMVLLWLLVLGYVAISAAFLDPGIVRSLPNAGQVFLAIVVTAAFYALGWGGISFASEHEENTYGLLRSLPLDPKSVLYGKLAWGVSSSLMLVAVLSILCAFFVGWFSPSWRDALLSFGQMTEHIVSWSIMVPLAMLIGLFWSLRMKRPLVAIGLAGASVVLISYVGSSVAEAWYRWAGYTRALPGSELIPWTAFLLGLFSVGLFFAVHFLAMRWLPNYQTPYTSEFAVAQPSTPDAATANVSATKGTRPLTLGFGRIFWLQRRQHYLPALVIATVAIVCALSGFTVGRRGDVSSPLFVIALAAAIGSLVFRSEHDAGRFRFLSQLGVKPFAYWTSRMLIPSICAGVVALSFGFIVFRSIQAGRLSGFAPDSVRDFAWMGTLGVFCIGQFCSIAYPRTVICIAMAALGSIVFVGWLFICGLIEVWPIFVCLPVAVSLLLASYLRVARWFQNTESWREWIIPAMPLVMIAAMPFAVAFYRVNEVEKVTVPDGFLNPRVPTEAELKGEQDYRKLFLIGSLLPPRGSVPGVSLSAYIAHRPIYLKASDGVVAKRLLAITSSPAVFPNEYNGIDTYGQADSLPSFVAAAVLLKTAEELIRKKKVDESLEYLKATLRLARHRNDGRSGVRGVRLATSIEDETLKRLAPWALVEGNTPEKVEQALKHLDVYRRSRPPIEAALAGDYQRLKAKIEDGTDVDYAIGSRQEWLNKLQALVPWEKIRTRRLHNLIAVKEANHLRSGGDWGYARSQAQSTLFGHILTETTPLSPSEILQWKNNVRGTMCQLGMIAHRMRHGEYPDSLDDVRLGEGVDELPNDAIPNDASTPAAKLIVRQRNTNAGHRFTGKVIVSLADDNELGEDFGTSSDDERFRHFVLPDAEHWSPEGYANLVRQSDEGSFGTGWPSFPNRYQSFPTAPAVDPYGTRFGIQRQPRAGNFAARRKVNELNALLEQTENETHAKVLQSAIANMFEGDDSTAKLKTLEAFARPKQVRDFFPQLKELLDDENTDVAYLAGRRILAALPFLPKLRSEVEDRLSNSPDRSIGIPIRNPENGHYYEVFGVLELAVKLEDEYELNEEDIETEDAFEEAGYVSELGFEDPFVADEEALLLDQSVVTSGLPILWRAALKAAGERTFRGMKGHLATITTKQENDFLVRRFSESSLGPFLPAWIGGSDVDDQGKWTWMCGPEKGSAFWDESTETSSQFVNWSGGKAVVSQAHNFLNWNTSVASFPDTGGRAAGRWVAGSESGFGDEIVMRYIVEYSPEDGPPPIPAEVAEEEPEVAETSDTEESAESE